MMMSLMFRFLINSTAPLARMGQFHATTVASDVVRLSIGVTPDANDRIRAG